MKKTGEKRRFSRADLFRPHALVGVTGFEPAASCSQTKNGRFYIPKQAFSGFFCPVPAIISSIFSIVFICSAAGSGQISGQ
ncbi:MAG: hypothetical protein IKS28_00555, partial [Clostridia bacterium]|nr:hypothetical protein [Clostridia bacterium]